MHQVGFVQPAGKAFRARVQFKEEGALRHIHGPWRPDEGAAKADLAAMRAVTGGPRLRGVLSLYPFGIKERRDGTPSFACQARRHVNKARRFLSDAPPGSLTRRLPKIGGRIFLSVSYQSFCLKAPASVDLSHS